MKIDYPLSIVSRYFSLRTSAFFASLRLIAVLGFISFSAVASAQIPQPASGLAVPAASMLQMLAGLLLVLAVIGAAAWLLKRFAANPGTAPGAIRVIAGAAVGQRERVVLVEIGGTWLVLGVAPGQVRALHSMPKDSAEHFGNASSAPPPTGFQGWLRQVMEKRNAG